MANSIEVTSTGQVVVTEVAEQTIEIVSPTAPLTVEVQTEGPQGPAGDVNGGLPTGGVVGNILLKSSSANYDAEWAATLDGGTFA